VALYQTQPIYGKSLVTMWTVCGHKDRNKSYMNYWEDSDPVDWPKEVTFKMPTQQRWPSHRKLAAAPVTPEAAQTPSKLVAVSGEKYLIEVLAHTILGR
jgi:hypothetical protein